MCTRSLPLILSCGLMLGAAGVSVARTWTDVKGRTLEGEMVSKTESSVTVTIKGTDKEIPLDKLSAADQKFVKDWQPAEEKKEDTQPGDADVDKYFSQPWPTLISLSTALEIEEEVGSGSGSSDASGKTYIYRSPNYEFVSNTRLSKVVVQRFAVLFEATRAYIQQIPYASLKAYKEGARYKVMLFDTMASYHRAGGPSGSAGVYMPRTDVIMVPCQSLGLVKRGSGWALDYDKTNKTLPHEITHQLMDQEYFSVGARGWFSEGIAEYIAATPYRSGKFSVNKAQGAIEQYATAYSKKDGRGRALGTDIKAPDLEQYMMMSYGEFTANGNFNYGLGALLVTYFNHYDGEGDAANIKNFLRALKSGKTGGEALEVLRAGRTFDQLEADITREWRKRGVKITFS